jgi:hypothetical protein
VQTTRHARSSIVLAALALLALGLPRPAGAADKLKPPQEVDVDPDRLMSFGRLSKAPFDKSINQPYLQATNLPTMDQDVEPYNTVVKPSRYDPQTGTIRGGIVEKEKEMRDLQARDRPVRPTSPAGIYRAEKVFTSAGDYVRPPTPLTLGGLKQIPSSNPLPDFQRLEGSEQSMELLPGAHVAPPLDFTQEGQNLQVQYKRK